MCLVVQLLRQLECTDFTDSLHLAHLLFMQLWQLLWPWKITCLPAQPMRQCKPATMVGCKPSYSTSELFLVLYPFLWHFSPAFWPPTSNTNRQVFSESIALIICAAKLLHRATQCWAALPETQYPTASRVAHCDGRVDGPPSEAHSLSSGLWRWSPGKMVR